MWKTFKQNTVNAIVFELHMLHAILFSVMAD